MLPDSLNSPHQHTYNTKLTPLAQKLSEFRKEVNNSEADYDLPKELEVIATCMGSEGFSYSLYEGGYLKLEDWIEGEDLDRLKQAIAIVGEFKDLVESLHEEF